MKRMSIIMQQRVEQITNWLQGKVAETKVDGLVVGVSGGLDSAVVANLIKRACPDDSLGIIMPLHSSPTDILDAEKVVQACNINYLTIDLSATHDVMFKKIADDIKHNNEWKNDKEQIADANLRARLRMSTLYTVATNYNYLVVGTDNAAEW